MAQAQIDAYKKLVSRKTHFFVSLSTTKHMRLYRSKSYKDMVLSFNINKSKSFIVTRKMWPVFKKYINTIDHEFSTQL